MCVQTDIESVCGSERTVGEMLSQSVTAPYLSFVCKEGVFVAFLHVK